MQSIEATKSVDDYSLDQSTVFEPINQLRQKRCLAFFESSNTDTIWPQPTYQPVWALITQRHRFNCQLADSGKSSSLKGFQDSSLADGKTILDLIDALQPGSVNYDFVKDGSTQEVRTAGGRWREERERFFRLHLLIIVYCQAYAHFITMLCCIIVMLLWEKMYDSLKKTTFLFCWPVIT